MKRLLVCLLLVGVVGCGGSVEGEAKFLANELSRKLPILDHDLVEGPSVNVPDNNSSVSPYTAVITFKVQADIFGEYTTRIYESDGYIRLSRREVCFEECKSGYIRPSTFV
jgi:hypothetical protein